MRTGELIAAVLVGALLFTVGYELGSAGRPEAPQSRQVDAAVLELEIQTRLEEKIIERECELVDRVIGRVEELLPEETGLPDTGSPAAGISEEEPGGTRAERLEKEFDALLARAGDEIERERMERETEAKAQELSRRKREPFDAATLREFEEARRRMLEERKKLKEEEERRESQRR